MATKRIKDLATGTPAAGGYLVVDPASGSTYKIPLIGSGGVIEYGSNSNGSYVRFADGTQVCWAAHNDSDYGPVITGEDGACRFKAKTWSFPAAFAAPPIVIHSGDAAGAYVDVLSAYAVTSTSCALEVGQYNSGTVIVNTSMSIAIGRWK